MNASITWIDGMKFACDNRGLKLMIDAAPEHGGSDTGPTPKELVLNAMMGCTAMDVVVLLKKMRQEITEFNMDVVAEKTMNHPVHFKSAVLVFRIKGSVEPEKLIKAVESSLTRYCGVNYMISKTCEISYKIILNEGQILEAPVKFIEPSLEVT
jgi:putative redox protein